ncbi:hypothetical protein [Clostridium cellulovorans]|uniref:Uncharacterized protein n=1 Tax=Clostridium cellulovorans (strain ATCC 35296 / DSM 3052 / OCM 3 / 743B) TaxID=573061 RepID=D9SL45_CLOC7|nr:hypothetical protein [Clostridium cellulovorans]ADL51561.1 hypothetical protein Clocel_1817 [Clostridium cellulovorans 743B]
MCRVYLGTGMKREDFEKYFEVHILKNFSSKEKVRIIWDYDATTLNFRGFKATVLRRNFMNIRKLELATIDVNADVVFISEFYKIPFKSQEKILKNINDNKFKKVFIILDKKENVDKYNEDFLDEFIHYNVKAANI